MNCILSAMTLNTVNSLLVWGCIGITLLVAFGWSATKKLYALNKKHHYLEIDNDSIRIFINEEEEDDECDGRDTLC